jgi:hypothetical protein
MGEHRPQLLVRHRKPLSEVRSACAGMSQKMRDDARAFGNTFMS